VNNLRTRSWRRKTAYCIVGLLGCYLAIVLFMVCSETTLVYPAPRYPVGYWTSPPKNIEDVEFPSTDGTLLHGWFLDHASPRATLLYFHGNGENISHLRDLMERFNEDYRLRVFAFDYRGYGKSQGQPHEVGLHRDARAAVQWLNKRTNTKPTDVIYHGRSIGGGVAVELAASTGCKALVLENTFATMPDAAANLYPWLPVRILMQNQYRSIDHISDCTQPLLQFHGTADQLVPYWSGRMLFNACPSESKQFVSVKNGGHNDGSPSEFWSAFGTLISQLE
jgi:uncharacterized protein